MRRSPVRIILRAAVEVVSRVQGSCRTAGMKAAIGPVLFGSR